MSSIIDSEKKCVSEGRNMENDFRRIMNFTTVMFVTIRLYQSVEKKQTNKQKKTPE